jgi:photosystem II stability/assembly factor-like uncharacterized protein
VSFLCAWALTSNAAVALAAAPLDHPDNTWTPLAALPEQLDGPVFAIAVSPIDPATVLVGTGSGSIYRSTDAGASWTPAGHGLGRGVLTIQFSPFRPGTVYAGSLGDGLWRSGDGGATWTKEPGVPSATVRSLGFARSITLAGSDSGLYSTRDGSTWSPYLSFSQLSLSAIAVAAVNDPPKFVAGGDASKGDEVLPLYVSQDGGGSWSNVKSLGSSTMVGAAAAGAVPAGADSRPLVVGTNAGAFLTTDGGTTWTQESGLPAIDFTSAAFVSNNPASFYLASDGGGSATGGLWASNDSGQTFRSLAAPVASVTALALSAEDTPTAYIATFRASDNWVSLWAYHDAGGTPVAPIGGIPVAAGPVVASTTGAPPPAPGNLDLKAFLTATEAPYIGLGVLSLLVLLTAVVLQVRRGREK